MHQLWPNRCLSQIFDIISQRREKTGFRGLILHDDIAQSHQTWITAEFLTENRAESYSNASYSSDPSLCNLLSFLKTEKSAAVDLFEQRQRDAGRLG